MKVTATTRATAETNSRSLRKDSQKNKQRQRRDGGFSLRLEPTAGRSLKARAAMIVVLMGVSGSGKTTIGTLLAQRLGVVFADADDYHPEANKDKMKAGHPLTDADREPWLEELNRVMRGWFAAGEGGVMACSALKESYRRTLAAGMPDGTIQYVLLDGSKELIASRLRGRHHEFMNPQLLESQKRTLERPGGNSLEVVNDRAPEEVVREIVKRVGMPG